MILVGSERKEGGEGEGSLTRVAVVAFLCFVVVLFVGSLWPRKGQEEKKKKKEEEARQKSRRAPHAASLFIPPPHCIVV